MDYLSKCLNLCSTGNNQAAPGAYAYEAFRKIPKIKGFSDILKLIENIGDEGGQTNRKLISMDNLIHTAGKVIG
jgi:hypothetical protein